MHPPNTLLGEVGVGKRLCLCFGLEWGRLVARQLDPLADIGQSASKGLMAIEKRKLFEKARGRWPLAMKITRTNGSPCFDGEPSLVDVHRAIEEACKPKGIWTDEAEWTGLANWSFHQALCALAERLAEERDIHRDEVTFEMFDEQMRSNLSDDCWSAERSEYEESPTRFH